METEEINANEINFVCETLVGYFTAFLNLEGKSSLLEPSPGLVL